MNPDHRSTCPGRSHAVRHLLIALLLLAAPLLFALRFLGIDETVTARGTIEFVSRTAVGADLAARVASVHCREGQRVRRGDLLCRLDTQPMRARLAEARARQRTAREALAGRRRQLALLTRQQRTEVAQLSSELRVAQVASREAADRLARQTRIKQLISRAALQASQSRADLARASEQARVARLAAARIRHERERRALVEQLAALRARLAALAVRVPLLERSLASADVRAPRDGVVLTPAPASLTGQWVRPGQAIVELGDPRDLQFVLRVDQREISRLAVDQRVRVHLDAFPYYVYRAFPGRVARISSAPLGERSPTGHHFRVLVALDDAALPLEIQRRQRQVDLQPGLGGEGVVTVNREVGLGRYLFGRIRKRLPANWTVGGRP